MGVQMPGEQVGRVLLYALGQVWANGQAGRLALSRAIMQGGMSTLVAVWKVVNAMGAFEVPWSVEMRWHALSALR